MRVFLRLGLMACLAVALGAGSLACGGASATPKTAEDESGLPADGAESVSAAATAEEATAEVSRAEALIEGGDLAGAQRILEAVVAQEPGNARAHYDLGLVFETAGDAKRAEDAYREAVRARPTFAEALNNLGLLVEAKGDHDAAIGFLERATKADANFAEAWVNLALAAEGAGKVEQAKGAYVRALALVPDDALTRANFGLLLLRAGESDAARTELREALKHADRTSVATLQALGNGLRRAGAPAEALEAMRLAVRAREAGPTPALLAELALAENAAGEKASAEKSLTAAIKLDPKYATAHYLLGNLLAARGAFKEAVTHFDRALKLEPTAPFAGDARTKRDAAKASLRQK
jgi:Tfp pilus assembly protein PilF